MKRIAVIAALALAACSGAEEPAAEETATEVAEVAAPTAVDGGPVAGVYEATGPDGTVLTQTLNADGTVTTVNADGETVAGTYTGGTATDPFCITQANEEGVQETACYAETIGDDGVWTATNTDDAEDVWTVVRVS